jgi:ATP-dependent DNA helicase RecQ
MDEHELLRRLTGRDDAEFRAGQRGAIGQLVGRRGRVLVVQRTGCGKSAVYFLPPQLLRDAGGGQTVLVSPLLALMRNQLAMAERAGVRAATINSDNTDDWSAIEDAVRAGDVDLLLISPERLNNPRFRREVLPSLLRSMGMLVVDEAHCISDWGHDFRPDYRRIARVIDALPPDVPVLCTTATANDRVVADVVEQLGSGLEVVRGPLERASLSLAVVELPAAAERLAWLATVVPTLPGSGIVYCLTVADTERVASWLRARGISAAAYSGQSEGDDRVVLESALLGNEVKVVVATSALGMGFDKPDLPFVVHYQSPGSPVAYYQQVGRAGRAVDEAFGILLRGREDADIQDHFIRTAFPPRQQAEHVVGLLAAAGIGEKVSIGDIEREVNARRTRIEAMLKVLEVEGAVERVDGGWAATGEPWAYDAARVEAVTAIRRAEQAAMNDYAETDACRMAFLRAQLDDPSAGPCGRCDRCTGRSWAVPLDPALVEAARHHLRSADLELAPRRQWPYGLAEVRGRIPADAQLRPGRALGRVGDGGWGTVAGAGDEEEVLAAAVELVRSWAPDPPPAWVTWVPGSAAGFAARLAAALGLPAVDAVHRRRDGPPQAEMANSAQQVRNVLGAFAVDEGAVHPGPVLLVDDLHDSGWTMTVVGLALHDAGAGPVHPFALLRRF